MRIGRIIIRQSPFRGRWYSISFCDKYHNERYRFSIAFGRYSKKLMENSSIKMLNKFRLSSKFGEFIAVKL